MKKQPEVLARTSTDALDANHLFHHSLIIPGTNDDETTRNELIMNTFLTAENTNVEIENSIQQEVGRGVEDLLASLPDPGQLSAEQRRGIIARYTAVLEG